MTYICETEAGEAPTDSAAAMPVFCWYLASLRFSSRSTIYMSSIELYFLRKSNFRSCFEFRVASTKMSVNDTVYYSIKGVVDCDY